MVILSMYVTLMPVIVSGILNMLFCKASIFNFFNVPVDFGKNFIDGKRIFGDNKTWKGIFGYLLLNTLMMALWGLICEVLNINCYNYFYINFSNEFFYNVIIGFLLGFAYSLFELPNSFIKRRLDIKPGKTVKGVKKIIFVFLDQADSIFGCCLVVWLFYKFSVLFYFLYVLVGAFTHILFNMLLYFLGVRKNMF